jgi:hypothetical protein
MGLYIKDGVESVAASGFVWTFLEIIGSAFCTDDVLLSVAL